MYCISDIDECNSTPCENGGVCENTVGSFTCNCTGTGFDGDNCTNSKYLAWADPEGGDRGPDPPPPEYFCFVCLL